MFDNPFSMVVAIVLIVSIAGVLRARYGDFGHRRSRRLLRGDDQQQGLTDSREAETLRNEVKMLKERIAVLERIATDSHETARIDQEIARLRDR